MTSTSLTTVAFPTRLGRLHARITGAGPTVVAWPSMFVDGHTFDGMIPALARDRRLVVIDGPGLGLSDPLARRSTISEAADAARDVIGALDAGPVDWIGNAFGGHVGLKLAQHEGVLRSLVAVSAPTEPIDDALRRQIRLLLPIVRTFGARGPIPGVVRKAMLTDASAARPEVRAVVDASLARPTRRSLALAIGSFILDRVDVTGGLDRIRVPSLFVASDDRGDWSPEAARAAAALSPLARSVTISGARTLVPLEQPERLAAVITEFWAAGRLGVGLVEAPLREHDPNSP
jgi:pimeloyl-ACP methyl ester carboxylesterase